MPLIDSTALFAANPTGNSYDSQATVVIGQDFYVVVNQEQNLTDNYEFKFGINNTFCVENVITVPVSRASTIANAQTESISYRISTTTFVVDGELFPGQIGFPVFVPVNVLENLDANVIAATRNITNVIYDSWS
jgi:hypothetical protein